MSKQISVKSVKSSGASIKELFEESKSYLTNIGFKKNTIAVVTDKENSTQTLLFFHGNEKVIIEFKQDAYEEVLNLAFAPMEIKFVYDILLMRFNQLAREKNKGVFIYEK
jgi:hypothetical protein